MRYKSATSLGPWELLEELGSGGNAEVWRARQQDGNFVALKILKNTKPDSEPYKRFRIEVDILRQLGPRPGLLPLLDASLPSESSSRNPAWLAMPIATKIKVALGDDPALETVIEAVAAISDTLASLAAEGISHRDIKPDNLYKYQDQWAIGDFGLVDFPSKEALTQEGRKLGPANFFAPEMLTTAESADGRLADVYSLAKTLWVLAAGQNFPPPGEIRTDRPQQLVSAYNGHPRISYLDYLIERATNPDPNARPKMDEFARELHIWLDPKITIATSGDLSDLTHYFNMITERSRRSEQEKAIRSERNQRFLAELIERMQPIAQAIADVSPNSFHGLGKNRKVIHACGELIQLEQSQTFEEAGLCSAVIVPRQQNTPAYVWSGIGVKFTDDERVGLVAGHVAEVDNTSLVSLWSDTCIATFGSVQLDQCIGEL